MRANHFYIYILKIIPFGVLFLRSSYQILVKIITWSVILIMVEEFRNLLFIFKYFGVTPITYRHNTKLCLKPSYKSIVILLISLIWSGVTLSFFWPMGNHQIITAISNKIQLLANSVTITTTLYGSVKNYILFETILEKIDFIEGYMTKIYIKIDFVQWRRKYIQMLISYLSYLIFAVIYDYNVSIIIYNRFTLWYWMLTTVPFVVYSAALLQSFVIIYWISNQYRCINLYLNEMNNIASWSSYWDGYNQLNESNVENAEATFDRSKKLYIGREKLSSFIHKLLVGLTELYELTNDIEEYYGLIFLSSFASLFVTTAIQMFYLYLMILKFDPSRGYSFWSLTQSLLIIIGNLFLVIGLPTICESAARQSKLLMNIFIKNELNNKKTNLEQQHLFILFSSMITNIKFSAFDFFIIDYKMLCNVSKEHNKFVIILYTNFEQQFFAATVTYLIIYIQFEGIEHTEISYDHSSKNEMRD